MYRARKTVEPKILLDASEFVDMIHTITFGKYFKFSVTSGDQTCVVFFSEQMSEFLSEVTNIQFDGTLLQYPYNLLNYGQYLFQLEGIVYQLYIV